METYKILDQEYPVTGYFTAPQIGTVPLVDLPQMSDERWEELAQENAVQNYTRRFGHPPESAEDAVKWQGKEVAEAIRKMEAAI